jgi:hypothetical protein
MYTREIGEIFVYLALEQEYVIRDVLSQGFLILDSKRLGRTFL